MRRKTPIAEIARKSDITVQSTDRISVVYRLMKQHTLAHVPVVEQNKIVGIISRKAIKQLGFGYEFDGRDDVELGMFDMLQVNQVMDGGTPHISLSATVGEVAELMAKNEFIALPAVHQGKPVGVIDIYDIVLFLLKAS